MFIATTEGLKMNLKSVEAIVSWKVLKTVRDIQCFFGFANFYRIFIKNYSQVVAPLTRLTSKDKLEWGPQAEKAFQDLKKAFTIPPILVQPVFAKTFYLETDALDFALEAIVPQIGVDGKLYPVPFYSQKFSAAKTIYEIQDKEPLAIVDSFQESCHFLKGTAYPVIVYMDHENLKYFMSACVLNRCQA
jgi:hypothetical protein